MDLEPKDILKRAREAKRILDRRRSALQKLRDLEVYLSATDYSRPTVRHSADRGSVERIAISSNMERLEKRIRQDAEDMATAKLEAIALISALDDNRMAELLWEYYINNAENWYAAAEACGYSYSHAMRLHGAALNILREKMRLNETNGS